MKFTGFALMCQISSPLLSPFFSNCKLIVLEIFKGEETPYYYSGDGTLEAYVRVGNESVKATATEMRR